MQWIRRLINAIAQHFLNAHIIRCLVTVTETLTFQNKMNHRYAGGRRKKSRLFFVKSIMATTTKKSFNKYF